ncbi:alpha/beta hydrolase family protein [Hymenobacter terrenus]|uniref:alpha/beta hydrolase family protein n=1 Tax=Hymenobacter terrenus TaxID=1629124 RepID=UPI0012E01992|nr:alpha/beta fold hydrolase [Hymenobacter terrenus]
MQTLIDYYSAFINNSQELVTVVKASSTHHMRNLLLLLVAFPFSIYAQKIDTTPTNLASGAPAYLANHPLLDEGSLLREYDVRFAQAMLNKPVLLPWKATDKAEIVATVKQALAFKEEWVPEIVTKVSGSTKNELFTVQSLQVSSWKNCAGAAHLYLPKEAKPGAKLPVTLLACGHGDGGKLYPSYRLMAENLASNGIAVLVPDNIGQGERTAMGHWNPVGVFGSGLTMQGLIVLETVGWLNWIHQQKQFDTARIAVCGNSGGGTLGLFLSAVASDKFSLLVSTGYPSSFESIAKKVKTHCRCNLIPGIVGKVEMWQVLGCFAPKPTFLAQGKYDEFFAVDIFHENALRLGEVYSQLKHPENLKAEVFEGLHGWDEGRIKNITNYVCNTFGLPFNSSLVIDAKRNVPAASCYAVWPKQALNADEVASAISGKKTEAKSLWEVFRPQPASVEWLNHDHPTPRGDLRDVFAQFELFLGAPANNNAKVAK